MDGEPGLLVGVEGVKGGGAGVARGIEVVDQSDAAVLEGIATASTTVWSL
jgi:hypothetical protein